MASGFHEGTISLGTTPFKYNSIGTRFTTVTPLFHAEGIIFISPRYLFPFTEKASSPFPVVKYTGALKAFPSKTIFFPFRDTEIRLPAL